VTAGDIDLEWINSLGEVVHYWGAGGAQAVDRVLIKKRIAGRGRLINDVMLRQPFLTRKSYQQMVIQTQTNVTGIPTWRFMDIEQLRRAVDRGVLKFPFIQKPDVGTRGEGVVVVRDWDDVDSGRVEKCVFQTFIPNDGDYRVLVVGGKVYGIVKRKAVAGCEVNNLSQGASGETVTDAELLDQVNVLATDILRELPYDVVGIDLIKPLDGGPLIFLEINSVPRWRHFEKASGGDVAKAIIEMVLRLGAE
jgi:glutathione synthase/RimK-type ligase-like ATP-grasp enzyme